MATSSDSIKVKKVVQFASNTKPMEPRKTVASKKATRPLSESLVKASRKHPVDGSKPWKDKEVPVTRNRISVLPLPAARHRGIDAQLRSQSSGSSSLRGSQSTTSRQSQSTPVHPVKIHSNTCSKQSTSPSESLKGHRNSAQSRSKIIQGSRHSHTQPRLVVNRLKIDAPRAVVENDLADLVSAPSCEDSFCLLIVVNKKLEVRIMLWMPYKQSHQFKNNPDQWRLTGIPDEYVFIWDEWKKRGNPIRVTYMDRFSPSTMFHVVSAHEIKYNPANLESDKSLKLELLKAIRKAEEEKSSWENMLMNILSVIGRHVDTDGEQLDVEEEKRRVQMGQQYMRTRGFADRR